MKVYKQNNKRGFDILSECGSSDKYPVSSEYNRFANTQLYDSDERSSEIFKINLNHFQWNRFYFFSKFKNILRMLRKLFDFQQVDDPALKKFEEKSNEKTAAAHTKGILMALSAGALYGIQVILT